MVVCAAVNDAEKEEHNAMPTLYADARSGPLHAESRQFVPADWMAAWPEGAHWHASSVAAHPATAMADWRQGIWGC